MSSVCYGIDLTSFDILNLVSKGKLVYEYSGKVTDGDIKVLKAGMGFNYPFPKLVFVKTGDARCHVLVGAKLIKVLVNFMSTEEYRKLTQDGAFWLFHVVMLDSSDPIARNSAEASIAELFKRFSV